MVVTGQIETCQAESQILHPCSRALFRWWEAMRAERAAPHRAQLDLKRVAGLVPDLFILERDRPRHTYRWRLAGTHLCELYRRELTGGDVFAGWDSFERDTMRRLLDGVTGRLQPAIMRLRLHTSLGQTIGAELVALPLQPEAILVIEGVFIRRIPFGSTPVSHIYLSAPSSVARQQLIARDVARGRRRDDIDRRLDRRYLPGQARYHAEYDPRGRANLVVDNSDYDAPLLLSIGATPLSPFLSRVLPVLVARQPG